MRRLVAVNTFIDALLVTGSFLVAVWLKPATVRVYLPGYAPGFLVFLILWLVMSLIVRKFTMAEYYPMKRATVHLLLSNLIIASMTALLMYIFRAQNYSRMVVFVTISLATILEWILMFCHRYICTTEVSKDGSKAYEIYQRVAGIDEVHTEVISPPLKEHIPENVPYSIRQAIEEESGEEVFNYLATLLDLATPDYTILSTTTRFNVLKLPENTYQKIVNLKRVNDIRFVNKFLEAVNTKMIKGGLFVGCVETKNQRKKRLLKKYPPVLNRLYYFLDFILKRVFPKFGPTKRIYFFLTRGQNRVLSKAEMFGRLYSCGFEIADEQVLDGYLYFVARKVGHPLYDMQPTYGPLVKLRRIGKGRKIIYVYKMRTMHPYAEYLQEYVYRMHDLQEGGKFKNDFRINTAGKFMRKFWLDELPMLINLLRGELKIVGVRPLSEHYFNLYDRELQTKRIKVKPGLVPPFYADMPKTLEEIQASEHKYLDAYLKHPLRTDWNYFWRALWNILFKKARSR